MLYFFKIYPEIYCLFFTKRKAAFFPDQANGRQSGYALFLFIALKLVNP